MYYLKPRNCMGTNTTISCTSNLFKLKIYQKDHGLGTYFKFNSHKIYHNKANKADVD
jgi:hypothetical protein